MKFRLMSKLLLLFFIISKHYFMWHTQNLIKEIFQFIFFKMILSQQKKLYSASAFFGVDYK